MRTLKGKHIVVAVSKEQKKASVITFKKVTRAGRKPQYKKVKVPRVSTPNDATPQPQLETEPEGIPFDDLLHDASNCELQDFDEDIPLPKHVTVSIILHSIGDLTNFSIRPLMITFGTGRRSTEMRICRFILSKLVAETPNAEGVLSRPMLSSDAWIVLVLFPGVSNA